MLVYVVCLGTRKKHFLRKCFRYDAIYVDSLWRINGVYGDDIFSPGLYDWQHICIQHDQQ